LYGQSAHREELAQPPHDAGEYDLDERIRLPGGRDNANSVPERVERGFGSIRFCAIALLRAHLFKKCSAQRGFDAALGRRQGGNPCG